MQIVYGNLISDKPSLLGLWNLQQKSQSLLKTKIFCWHNEENTVLKSSNKEAYYKEKEWDHDKTSCQH